MTAAAELAPGQKIAVRLTAPAPLALAKAALALTAAAELAPGQKIA